MTNRFRRHLPRPSLLSACVCLTLVACASTAGAQQPTAADPQQTVPKPPDNTAYLTPSPNRISRTLTWIGSKLDTPGEKRDGFYPQTGGMITGAGLSIGPGYRHHLFGDHAVFDVSAGISWKRYKMVNAQLEWPGLMHDKLTLGALVKYQDFTRINYFGIGNDTVEDDRTNFRLKDVDTLGFATVRVNQGLTINGRAGVLRRLKIRPGTSTLYPPIADLFDDSTAPSLVLQPDYVHADIALDVDTRNIPGYPSRGGRYRASMAGYHDQSYGRYGFRRFESDGAQYLPLGRAVISLRGRINLSQSSQEIPFYLLPALGGTNSLRGYQDYRFRDRNLLMGNAEFRWPIHKVADLAVFYDAGTVAADAGDLTKRLHKDYGVGVRAHSATHTVARVDIARSVEGTRFILSFTAPLALPNRSVAPYVP